MQNLNIIQVTPTELKRLIEEVFDSKLKSFNPVKIDEDEYLNRKEAAKLLNIGLTKLNKLTNIGVIVPLKEGRSVFYLKSSLKEYRESLIRRNRGHYE